MVLWEDFGEAEEITLYCTTALDDTIRIVAGMVASTKRFDDRSERLFERWLSAHSSFPKSIDL
jgi:hypothetical protein